MFVTFNTNPTPLAFLASEAHLLEVVVHFTYCLHTDSVSILLKIVKRLAAIIARFSSSKITRAARYYRDVPKFILN